MKADQVRELELTNSEMWVAKEIQMLGEWYLRANDGVTWRANSVLPIGSSGLSIDESLDYCIEFYTSREIPPCFQLTSFSSPNELDTILQERGWAKGITVETMIRALDHPQSARTSYEVNLQKEPTEGWIESFMKGSGRKKGNEQIRLALMTRSNVPKAFVYIDVDGIVASVGLGMVHRGWLGIFRLGTLPEYRNKGLATALNDALLQWGYRQNARRAFLQVEDDNPVAKSLYQKIGFEYAYTYWYRYQK